MRFSTKACMYAALIPPMLLTIKPVWAGCSKIPAFVKDYIVQQTGWRLLTDADLGTDLPLWLQDHGKQCPGYSPVNFDGTGRLSYAIALVREAGSVLHERLDVVSLHKTGLSIQHLATDWDGSGPWVTFPAKPGTYTDIETSRKFAIQFDGIVFEKMESADHLYYVDHGKVVDVMLSD